MKTIHNYSEPWGLEERDGELELVTSVGSRVSRLGRRYLERIVECVNRCAGEEPKLVADKDAKQAGRRAATGVPAEQVETALTYARAFVARLEERCGE